MFEIKGNAFYSKEDIAVGLGDTMAVDQFLSRLQPVCGKPFKSQWLGSHLLEAIGAISEDKVKLREQRLAELKRRLNGGRRRRGRLDLIPMPTK
jgi:hypothetical protein